MWYTGACLLVVLRCLPSMAFEQFNFDSDQAVVGLMAKHLANGRGFPLFFYGQNYMLGVEAWVAAPFIALGGANVTMLRLPVLVVNVVVVVWLMTRLRRGGVPLLLAFVATLPLIAPGALASTLLMQTLGASVEPFLYVLLLWHLRRRPAGFGALFAVAYLHREFVLFVLPALVLVWLLDRPRPDRALAGQVARAALAFAAVWIGIAAIARRINTLGPAGGEVAPGSLFAQSEMVVLRLAWNGRAYLDRLEALFRNTLPDLFATHAVPASLLGLNSTLVVGAAVGGIAFAVALGLAALGIVASRSSGRASGDGFHLYLGAIGAQAILAYALNGGIDPRTPGVARYVLFALLLPIALLGAFVERHPPRALVAAVVAAMIVWAGVNVRDSVGLVREYLIMPPPDDYRVLADYLVSHRIRYGRANYWDAYLVDFLSGERVILAPTAVMRISAYDARVARNGANAVTIVRQPCDAGTRVAAWCIEDPLQR